MINIYKASAGSGKTFTLAREFIKYMLGHKIEGTDRYELNRNASVAHRKVMAMTFTNKATEEMKSRIIHELAVLAHREKGWTQKSLYEEDLCKSFGCTPEALSEAADEALSDLLYDFGRFNISTIDSFFQTVLRAFAHEAEVSSNYALELDDKEVIRRSVDRLLQSLNRADGGGENGSKLEAWLVGYMKSLVESGSQFALFNRDGRLHGNLIKFINNIYNDTFKENEELIMDYLTRPGLFDKFCLEIFETQKNNFGLDHLLSHADALLNAIDTFPPKTVYHHFVNLIKRFVSLGKDIFIKGLGDTAKAIRENPDKVWTATARKAGISDPVFEASATDFCKGLIQANSDITTIKVIKDNIYQLGLLSAIMQQIERFRIENSTLLLSDTNSLLANVIGGEDSPFLYERLGNRFNHYLIDEFQDTSLSQWNNIRGLLKESLAYGHDSLVIGDEKQCIYRFRDSDPTLLQNLHNEPWIAGDYVVHGNNVKENTNWRSSIEVINFNNSLFTSIASIYGLTNVYSNVIQAIPDKSNRHGYVSVKFMKETRGEDNVSEPLQRMASEIRRQLEEGHYRPNEIAILVRDSNYGKTVFNFIEQIKQQDSTYPRIDVISDSSLLISRSNAVASIISRLRLLSTLELPRKFRRRSAREIALVLDEYDRRHALGASPEEAIEAAIAQVPDRSDESSDQEHQPLMSPANTIHSVDLMSLIEHIIDTSIDPSLKERDNIFITAFVDNVATYLSQGNGDVMSFLEWWDDCGDKQSIPGGDNSNAITILTMHKSKGLEFPCVHVPFAGFGENNRGDISWFKCPEISGFDSKVLPPMLPLTVSKTLLETPFASEYSKLMAEKVIDITNLLYVTFTRAIDELIISVGVTQKVIDGNTTDTASAILFRGMQGAKSTEKGLMDLSSGADVLEFRLGTPTTRREDTSKQRSAMRASVSVKAPDYTLNRHDAVWGNTAVDLTRLNSIKVARERGLMLHQIMSLVHTTADIPAAMNVFAASADASHLTPDELSSIREIIESRVNAIGARLWFEGFDKAYLERELVLPDGSLLRVDRVVWTASGELHVIDYKSGIQPANRYYKQVRAYMSFFRTITSLPVRGFLYFLDSGVIHEVTDA